MKHFFVYISIIFLSVNASYAQSLNETNIGAIKKQVEAKAKTFCKYVVAIGTSPGQKGAVADDVKLDMIRNQVPGLFYEYYEAPHPFSHFVQSLLEPFCNKDRFQTYTDLIS